MTRILLIDDHFLFREGLKSLLAQSPDLRVVADAGDYAQGVDALRRTEVDVAIVDLSLPGRDGVDLIGHIRLTKPHVAILVLTMHEKNEYAKRALRAGALGYLTKLASPDELAAAVRRVAAGRRYVSASVSEGLMYEQERPDNQAPLHETLSRREFRIFEMLVACQTPTSIARELQLSVKTVSTHKQRLLKKMGLNHQGELVRYAIDHALFGP